MEDLGSPIAYTVLEEGTPVYDRNGKRIGVVEHVVADLQSDIFDGLIVHTHPLPGRHRFADVDQIAELHERGVLLSIERDELHRPPDEKSEKSRHEDRPENPVPLVRGEIRELNRDIPVTFHTPDDELAAQTLQPRFNAVLLGIFSGIALLLATVGTYAGSQRRRNLV